MNDNKILSVEEKIARIEKAPKEMQLMVAKAFLRDDIDDNQIQYLFNTDTIEELNERGAEGVENVNAELPEGIGAGEFSVRNSKPAKGNKNFITKGSGGWNTCIKGYPQDKDCNVLANCVGYASGRFNEIINEARDTAKCTYTTLNCNAENFIEKAKAAGLKTGSTPKVGAIGVCQKGTLSSTDGAGHVWIVERVVSNSEVYTSESGYGGDAFWNQTRKNTNGRWGMGSAYSFRAFIYLPDDVQAIVDGKVKPQPTPEPTPTPTPSKTIEEIAKEVIRGDWGNGDERKKRLEAAGYNASEVQKKVNELLGSPSKPEAKLAVGDKVKIVGVGNGSSRGTGATAYGIGWTRQILDIYEGRPYKYRVGNSSGTTGYYNEKALQKVK